jgi:hypothetical protein
MYRFPILIPEGWRVILTQGFSDAHTAIDVVIGTPEYQQWATYGAAIVCPFPEAELISFDPGTDPGDPKAGRFQLRYTQPDGTQIIMGGLHCSDVIQKQFFKEGEVVAYIGNGGFVNPKATVEDAYAGGHLHLSYTYRTPGGNGVPMNPLAFFDIDNPYRGQDSGFEHDIRPIAWAMRWTREYVDKVLKMFRDALVRGYSIWIPSVR